MKKYLLASICFLFASMAKADSKLTALTKDTTAQSTDLFYKVDNPGGTPASRSISGSDLFKAFGVSVYPATSTIITPQGINSSTGTFTDSITLTEVNQDPLITLNDLGSPGGGFLMNQSGNQSVEWIQGGSNFILYVTTASPSASITVQPRIDISNNSSTNAKIRFNESNKGFDLQEGSMTFLNGGTNPVIDWTTSGQFKIANSTLSVTAIRFGDGTVQVSSPTGNTGAVGISIDGGGNPIIAGSTRSITIPYSCTISSWTIISDVSGSISIHISSSSYNNYPTLSNISGPGNSPTLISQQKNASTPTGWNGTTLGSGAIVSFVVDSASTVTWCNVVLWLVRS